MEKPAETTYAINDLIKRRWSPRAFREVPVAAGQLHALFEAARWAASSFNEQPWSFIMATRQDEEKFKVLFDCLVEGNQKWVARVPVLMLSVAKMTLDRNGKPNRFAYHDVGQALANMAIEATHLGLAVHPMGGFDVEKAREDLAIPEDYDPVTMIAVGHPGDFDELPDELKRKELEPRTRKPSKEFVYSGKFGEPMPFESRVKRALMGD